MSGMSWAGDSDRYDLAVFVFHTVSMDCGSWQSKGSSDPSYGFQPLGT